MNKDIENRLKEYGEFEKNIDNIVVSSFDYSSAYLNDILDFFHMNIAVKYSGERFGTNKYNIEPSTSFSSIFSYLLPFLNYCKKDFNENNFKSTFINQMLKLNKTLINYGLFSEVAPFVWREVYSAKITGKNLKMDYKDNYYEYEVKDSILTSIATGFSASNDLENAELYDKCINILINSNVDLTEKLQIQETKNSKEWYKQYRFDDLTISQELYNDLGISKYEYIEFQSFWLGITTYYIKMYEALVRYTRNTGNLNDNLVQIFLIHFASPNLKKEYFYKNFKELIGIKEDRFLRLMNIFSLDIDIDKKMFNLIDFKYNEKMFKLKDRLVLSLQKNMNLNLLNFLIKHFKNELNFNEFKLEQDFLYKGSLYKDFILKAIEIKLFDFNNLNIKCYSNKFTILNYLARTTIFHDSNEPSFYKDTFIFYYSLGYNYDFDELADKYKVLIEDIKEAKQNLRDNKSKLNFILQTMHIDINNNERDLINKAKNSIKTIDNLKQNIQDIIYKIELGNIELERERNRNK